MCNITARHRWITSRSPNSKISTSSSEDTAEAKLSSEGTSFTKIKSDCSAEIK